MIGIWGVAVNGLWVLGLALVLAAVSWAHWIASLEEIGTQQALQRVGLRCLLALGSTLF